MPVPVELWRAIAFDQAAAANRSLLILEAARWDPSSRCFRVPRGGVLDDFFSVPPEFTRDIGLGRLQAAVRERAELWQRIAAGDRMHCMICQSPIVESLMLEHWQSAHMSGGENLIVGSTIASNPDAPPGIEIGAVGDVVIDNVRLGP